jgi:hypothetical protein
VYYYFTSDRKISSTKKTTLCNAINQIRWKKRFIASLSRLCGYCFTVKSHKLLRFFSLARLYWCFAFFFTLQNIEALLHGPLERNFFSYNFFSPAFHMFLIRKFNEENVRFIIKQFVRLSSAKKNARDCFIDDKLSVTMIFIIFKRFFTFFRVFFALVSCSIAVHLQSLLCVLMETNTKCHNS